MSTHARSVLVLLALVIAGCGGGAGGGKATPGSVATAHGTTGSEASGGDAISRVFAVVLGDLIAGGHPSGATPVPGRDPTLLRYLPDIHGFDHYDSFDIQAGPPLGGAGTMDSAGKIARKGRADGTPASASLVAVILQPSDAQQADRVAAELRVAGEADLRRAVTTGDAGMFSLNVQSLRVLNAEEIGDAGAAFEVGVAADSASPLASFASVRSGSVTLRVFLLVRGGRIGAIVRVGFVDINPEGPPGGDPDLALAKALDAKLKGAE